MALSDGEKLILVMLCDIQQHLKIEGEVDPELVKKAVADGHLWALKSHYSGIFAADEADSGTVEEVRSILNMWSAIEFAYSELSPSDKARVEKEAAPFGKQPKFNGFDGNNETEELGIARFLINDLGHFGEFDGRDLNSHMPSIDRYRQMLAVFTEVSSTSHYGKMSADALIEVLNAARVEV